MRRLDAVLERIALRRFRRVTAKYQMNCSINHPDFTDLTAFQGIRDIVIILVGYGRFILQRGREAALYPCRNHKKVWNKHIYAPCGLIHNVVPFH